MDGGNGSEKRGGGVLTSPLGAGLSAEGKVIFNDLAETRCTLLVVAKALKTRGFPVLYVCSFGSLLLP